MYNNLNKCFENHQTQSAMKILVCAGRAIRNPLKTYEAPVICEPQTKYLDFTSFLVAGYMRESENSRDRLTDGESERDRENERERDRQTDRHRVRERQTDRQIDSARDRETETQRERE